MSIEGEEKWRKEEGRTAARTRKASVVTYRKSVASNFITDSSSFSSSCCCCYFFEVKINFYFFLLIWKDRDCRVI